jgi:hypothetical protein
VWVGAGSRGAGVSVPVGGLERVECSAGLGAVRGVKGAARNAALRIKEPDLREHPKIPMFQTTCYPMRLGSRWR